jgi:hypothetical protein
MMLFTKLPDSKTPETLPEQGNKGIQHVKKLTADGICQFIFFKPVIRSRINILGNLTLIKEKQMNAKKISIVGMLAVTFSSVAVAGPDWEIIHRAEARKISHDQELMNNGMKRNVTFLEHGPSATSTPYMNAEQKLESAQKRGSRN